MALLIPGVGLFDANETLLIPGGLVDQPTWVSLLIPGVGPVEFSESLLLPGAMLSHSGATSEAPVEPPAEPTAASSTPLQNLLNGFGPALAARMNGVMQ